MKHYVIIGNGTAAVSCIEGVRSVDTEAEITVVSAEKYPAYCRPLISYYLEGKTDAEKMKYRPADFYEKNGCEVLYGRKAVAIKTGEVTLDDGSVLKCDGICVAAGSTPFVPPTEGLEEVEEKTSFMTLDDAKKLEEVVTKDTKVLIVGAGLIGLKCAEGLHGRAGQITVCDLAPRILSSILDDDCAAIMQKQLEENSIRIMTGDSAVKYEKNLAHMQSGKTVEFDVLVLAVGVRPNTALVKDAGGEVNRGIVVNSKLETTVSGIYAAGDCTEGYDNSLGANRILALLPNANFQGYTAGVNMAGGKSEYNTGIPMNSLGLFGCHAMTAGSYFTEEDGGEMYEVKDENGLKRLYTKDGLLTGFIIIGNVDRAGIYTSMIRNKTPLSSVDFELLKKSPVLAAFSQDYRREKLGGVV